MRRESRFRIQTHNFSAEYGHTAGSQVSIVSKAGTNDFHGTAWEFHRNSTLNARSFFQTRKPQQRQNQTGASAGGAIIRNKAYWFGSFQRLWDRSEAGSAQTLVPTDAQRAGDFTALSTQLRNPINPITNAPFTDSSGAPCVAGNVIRAGCISQVSRDLLDLYVPRSASGTVVTLSPAPRDHAVYMVRGDYHFSITNQQHVSQHAIAGRQANRPRLLVLGVLCAVEEQDEPAGEHDGAHMIAQYFNVEAFVPLNSVPRGIYGNAARGLIYGPGNVGTDFAVLRYINLGEDARLQLRGEFFNAFNHVNFGNPNTTVSSTSFGRITGAGAGRVIQLAAKVIW
jgi:hypothetical protein